MAEKLTWEQIEDRYSGGWVELIDFDWEETERKPQAGVVRVHSKNRKEFDKLLLEDPPEASAIVYVGKVKFPKDIIFNANLCHLSLSK